MGQMGPMGPIRFLLITAARPHHRFKNFHIAGAPAKIPRQAVSNLSVRGLGNLFEQFHGGDYHPRRADAALGAAAFNERLLYGVQLVFAERNTLDSFDRTTFDLRCRNQTAVHNLSVNHYSASAAFTLAA